MSDISRERVQSISWYHQIPLPDGHVTPGVNDSLLALSRLPLGHDLHGKRVLDVGAWDGFYSLEAARRGAERVVATDSFVWDQPQYGKGGFDLAMEAYPELAERIEARHVDVMDLHPGMLGGDFDIVLCLGVLYHLRDPIGALQRVSGLCRGQLIIETETALNWVPLPAARLWPGAELSDDPTNWWSFNSRSLVAMLHSLSFRSVDVAWRTSQVRRLARALRQPMRFSRAFQSARIVVSAHR